MVVIGAFLIFDRHYGFIERVCRLEELEGGRELEGERLIRLYE